MKSYDSDGKFSIFAQIRGLDWVIYKRWNNGNCAVIWQFVSGDNIGENNKEILSSQNPTLYNRKY